MRWLPAACSHIVHKVRYLDAHVAGLGFRRWAGAAASTLLEPMKHIPVAATLRMHKFNIKVHTVAALNSRGCAGAAELCTPRQSARQSSQAAGQRDTLSASSRKRAVALLRAGLCVGPADSWGPFRRN